MKLADAQAVLKESQGSHLCDLIIPSTGEKIAFKPMTLGHHKTIAKMALDDETTFNKFLCALLLDLSDNKIDLSNITEIDKVSLIFQLKQFNSPEPLKVSLECPKCQTNITVKPDLTDVIKIDIEQEIVKTMDVAGVNFEINIGIPSVEDSLKYSEFCEKRFELVVKEGEDKTEDETDLETQRIALFIASYEMFLMFIKGIKINGQQIEDYKSSTIEQRINFLETLSEGLIDIKEIGEFASDKYNQYGYHVKCPKGECGHEYDNLFSPDSFFF